MEFFDIEDMPIASIGSFSEMSWAVTNLRLMEGEEVKKVEWEMLE